GFASLIVWEDFLIAPSFIAELEPEVVVRTACPAMHHRIDRAASAQYLSARPIELAVIELRLRLSEVSPIERPLEQTREGSGHSKGAAAVRSSSFKQQDVGAWIFSQPVSQYTSGRPGSYYYVMVHSFLRLMNSSSARPRLAPGARDATTDHC